MSPLAFVKLALAQLANVQPHFWAAAFVRLRMDFFRQHQNGLILATSVTGPDFFDELHRFFTSDDRPTIEEDETQYQKNYRTLVKNLR